MRILHVYRTYFPDSQGGLEEVIRQICLNTKAHGVLSRVLALSNDARPQIVRRDEGRVYRAHLDAEVASCSVSFSALRTFKRLVAWADVVHYHFPWPFADVLHFAARVNKPALLTYHSDIVRQRFLNRLYAPLMNRFLGSVDRIVCTSPNYFATSPVLSQFSDKVEIVPIGLNKASYPDNSADDLVAAEQRYGRNFFLFVGVLRYYKGLHILLDAIKDAPYSVVIVGSGPTEEELKAKARKLGLNNLIFAGRVNDATKVALFKLARAVVFPSYLRSEAFGVTLLEGAMYSRALISTEVGSGTSHVNIDGETGFVVPPGSATDLRSAMDQLHYRPELATLMGKRAHARYEKLFTGSLMGTRYAELYRELLNLPEPRDVVTESPMEIETFADNDQPRRSVPLAANSALAEPSEV
ncbi:MAG: glycosyltransferase [Pseudomonadota bacterium]